MAPTEHIDFDVMGIKSGHRSVTTSSFISNFPKYAVIVHMAHTDMISFSPYLHSGKAAFCAQAACQAPQTQTITIFKRQIPSIEWSY